MTTTINGIEGKLVAMFKGGLNTAAAIKVEKGMKPFLHILVSLLLMISFCSCSTMSSFTSDFNQKSDVYFFSKYSSNINDYFKCHLNLNDSTFEYRHRTSVDFIHYQGKGHWHSKGNTIVLDFDYEPDISRFLEGGWFYRDKLIFEYKNHKLILREHINPEGESWVPQKIIKMKEITPQEYNKLFF
ncbi:MAG: hypothetical protein IKX31_06595 [Muribaculaceae bacterium]|nr:hypothetical protein [Muribaculaceae bacterium]